MRTLELNFVRVLFVALAILLLAGCNRGVEAKESDARGFQCQKCKAKFFTDKDVWPEFCPSCKASGPTHVAGFFCSKDKTVTIPEVDGQQPGGTVKCAKCSAPVEMMQDPTAAELQAWGATKKTRKDVSAN